MQLRNSGVSSTVVKPHVNKKTEQVTLCILQAYRRLLAWSNQHNLKIKLSSIGKSQTSLSEVGVYIPSYDLLPIQAEA